MNTGTVGGGLQDLITALNGLVQSAIPLVAGIALLGFFWGLVKFILKAGDEKAQEEGKRLMIWGVVALFVMVSVWGLVAFIADNLGIPTGESITIDPLNL